MANEVEIVVTSTDKTRAGFDSVDKGSSKLSGAMGKVASVAKVAAVGLVGAAAGAVAFGKSAVAEAREAQKVGAQTEAVIKSTGGAANVTASQVGDLAGALSMKAGIDDEVIQSGANMLLTFKNIRNEAGAGNDIFDQTTSIMTDMSVAMGQDMKSSALQLGKALNDPIKGVGALSRVGVTFTDQQKKQIETLVESGNTMKAQKIILGELKTEFGGSAAAQATAGDKAAVAWGNFQEMVGTKLLPILDKLSVWFVEDALPAIQAFVQSAQEKLTPVVRDIRDVVADLVAYLREHWPEISKVVKEVMGNVVAIIRGVVQIIRAIWNKWGEDMFRIAKIIFTHIITQIRAALKVIRGVIDVVTGLIKGDWSQVWRGIQRIFGGVWDSIKGTVRAAIAMVREVIRNGWDAVKDITRRAWDAIKDAVRNAGGAIRDAVGNLWQAARDRTTSALSGIKDRVVGVWSSIVSYIKSIPGKLAGVFSNIWSGITGGLRDAVNSALGLPMVFPGWDWPGPGGIGAKTLIPALARGGVTTGPTLAMIGDNPSGREAVIPLDRAGNLGLGGGQVVIEIRSGGSRLDDLLVEVLRKSIRIKGGDVQAVLGA